MGRVKRLSVPAFLLRKDCEVTDSAPGLGTTNTITRQVHRGSRGVGSWWDTVAVCDLPGSFGPQDLLSIIATLPAIRRMGFGAVLVRLALQDVAPQQNYIAKLVAGVHAAGLRLIVRVSPDDVTVSPLDSPPMVELGDDPATLVERTRLLLETGIDGVDLGMIDEAADAPDSWELAEKFSGTVNKQLAELASADSTVILTAEASTSTPAHFHRHLQEDWFHHLRDDSLFQAPWDAAELKKRIADAYSSRAPLGRAVAWRPALSPWREGATYQRVSAPGSWSDGASSQRATAFIVYVASLPGSLYLPFTSVGGEVMLEGSGGTALRISLSGKSQARFQHDLTTRMLHLRKQKGLADANLASIDGLSWASPQVAVHITGPVMVVLNASGVPVRVPAHHQPLLYSDGFVASDGDATVLQPETCAWFTPAAPRTHDPADKDRWDPHPR